MPSFTQRIKEIKQTRGGYLNPNNFEEIQIEVIQPLNEEENIHAILIGLSSDYLTRFSLGATSKDAFKISLLGASI